MNIVSREVWCEAHEPIDCNCVLPNHDARAAISHSLQDNARSLLRTQRSLRWAENTCKLRQILSRVCVTDRTDRREHCAGLHRSRPPSVRFVTAWPRGCAAVQLGRAKAKQPRGNANATTAVRGLVRSPGLGSFHASASRARRERVGTGPRLSPSRRVCAAC